MQPHFYHDAVNSLLGAAEEIRVVIDRLAGCWKESSHLLCRSSGGGTSQEVPRSLLDVASSHPELAGWRCSLPGRSSPYTQAPPLYTPTY